MNCKKRVLHVISAALVIMAFFVMVIPAAQAQVTEEWTALYSDPGVAFTIATDTETGNIYVAGVTSGDFSTVAYDSSGNQLWVARYSGGMVRAMAVDTGTGNVYVTGYSTGGSGYADYTTVAYDSLGNQLWVAGYNGPGNFVDDPRAIATDNAGNVYVTGQSDGGVTSGDFATVAYDPSGNQLWVARYNGPTNYYDYANAIATDKAGNVFVTGASRHDSTSGDSDIITIAYDSSGNQLWVASYYGTGTNWHEAAAMATDKAGNVYVTGFARGTTTGICDMVTVAYDPSGNQLWVAGYDGPGITSTAKAIAVDKAGTVYVAGQSYDSGSRYDYATVAYDPQGNQLWTARYNGTGNHDDIVQAMAIDKEGNVFVTGYSWGYSWIYLSEDYATVAYDPSGNQLWVHHYNDPGNYNDYAHAIATDRAGNVYVTGSSSDYFNNYYLTIKLSWQ